jgi:hypothetical protein
VAPDTTLTGPSGTIGSRTATFTASASEPGATFACSLDGGAWAACASPGTFEGLAVGDHTLAVRAVDRAGNADPSPASAVWTVDTDDVPPGPVRRAKARGGDHAATLTWALPPDVDVDHVEIRRSRLGKGAKAAKPADLGLASAFVDRRLRNGVRYRYTIVVVDESGNRSQAVSVEVTPKLDRLVGPGRAVPGSRVALHWVPVKGASFYNVQVFRGLEKVLSVWPGRARLALGPSWTWEGVRRTLEPGRYTWYVWPAYGTSPGTARYGELLGKDAFRVARGAG